MIVLAGTLTADIGRYLVARFLGLSPTGKTEIWEIVNKTQGATLGTIFWSGRWRQYVASVAQETDWSAGCLEDLARFLQRMNREHNAVRKGTQPGPAAPNLPTRRAIRDDRGDR